MATKLDSTTRTRFEESVQINTRHGLIEGSFAIPEQARGAVIFAHGSSSSRLSPRNRFVAQVLHDAGIATLLIDLLTAREEHDDAATAEHRFNIALLAERLTAATDWLNVNFASQAFRVGYFGASTGAAAALVAAAERPAIAAVVSRGGRPDLATTALRHVYGAVLLIVGGDDEHVVELNMDAYRELREAHLREVKIIPGTGHLFEEPGALEEVARLAAQWFGHFLSNSRQPTSSQHGESFHGSSRPRIH